MSAVAVVDGVVEVTLASTAVAMAAQSGGGGLSSAGGPGKWVQVNESMSERARAYQAQVTGAPEGSAYRLQEGDTVVDFDGFDPAENVLLEAKGPGHEKFLKADMTMKDFYRGFRKVLDPDRGTLITLTPEKFTVSNPAHVALAEDVQARLQAAGLLTPLRPWGT